jgi:hypothetical protein
MNGKIISVLILLLLPGFSSCASTPTGTTAEELWIAHDVYFGLEGSSSEEIDAFVDACWADLSEIEGIRFFASGRRAESIDGPVNDVGFDASIHIFFVDQAAHDAYITDPRHVGFVERFRDSWSYVKVCDSLVEARLDP